MLLFYEKEPYSLDENGEDIDLSRKGQSKINPPRDFKIGKISMIILAGQKFEQNIKILLLLCNTTRVENSSYSF